MATPEEVNLAHGVIRYLASCQRDLRANAQSYKDEIARSPRRLTTAQLGANVTTDAQNINRLLQRIADKAADANIRTKITNGLAAVSIAFATANNARATLKGAADAQASADVSTDQAISAAADATLAAVPAFDTID